MKLTKQFCHFRSGQPRLQLFLAAALGAGCIIVKPDSVVAGIPMGDPVCKGAYCKDPPFESADNSREYDMKAAMLYRCLQLVKWPSETSSTNQETFTIGLLGKTQFAASLESLTGKTISSRKLAIKKLSQPADATNCQAVFICASEKKKTAAILKQLAGAPVLTVGETPQFAEQGGIINLLRDGKHIRLELNLASAEKNRFTIDPELIKWVPLTAGKH